jgi:hypothetical protein
MATTENMESSSPEYKGDHGAADSDSKVPHKVLYCGGKNTSFIDQRNWYIDKHCEWMPVIFSVNSFY